MAPFVKNEKSLIFLIHVDNVMQPSSVSFFVHKDSRMVGNNALILAEEEVDHNAPKR